MVFCCRLESRRLVNKIITQYKLVSMGEIIAWVLNHLNYWVIFLGMTIESSFIPFPSEAVIPPAAWMANNGTLNIFWVVVIATLGADAGALVNYYLAYFLGRPVIYRLADTRWAKLLLIDRAAVEKSEDFFRRHGITSTLVGRLVPGVRQLIRISQNESREVLALHHAWRRGLEHGIGFFGLLPHSSTLSERHHSRTGDGKGESI